MKYNKGIEIIKDNKYIAIFGMQVDGVDIEIKVSKKKFIGLYIYLSKFAKDKWYTLEEIGNILRKKTYIDMGEEGIWSGGDFMVWIRTRFA